MKDDLISRQAALQAMDTWDKFGCGPDGRLIRYDDDSHYVPYVHYDDMVHAIEHLPSAEPEKVCIARINLSEEQVREAVERAKNEIVQVLSSAKPEQPPEIQDILNYLNTVLHPIISPEHWDVYSELHDMISSLSSAEPEIIRCKDCKHWIRIKRTNRYWCKTDDGLYDLNPSPDDFCSRAERRTDE